ncbi:hypothetical protein HGRIS_006418 [Hohenbuehelia grisea]|uniref:Peroxidase n=1 Tax=Hohenbuehelia grisea TaxID=104357 RepID=A0ABR3JZW6_9AGAR
MGSSCIARSFMKVMIVVFMLQWSTCRAAFLGVPETLRARQTQLSNPQCNKWLDIRDELQSGLFDGASCKWAARSAVRLAFHDSIGYSKSLEAAGSFPGGGADGSILQYADIELSNFANGGLDSFVNPLRAVADKYQVTYGDMIQFASAVGVSNCPGAPQLDFFAGRPAPKAPAPQLIPGPGDNVTSILARMDDSGFTADDTVALLASHSIGTQRFIDGGVSGLGLDSTPAVFDNQFYLETMLKASEYPGNKSGEYGEAPSPMRSQFRLASDAGLARDPRTACLWETFATNREAMVRGFKESMSKVALNGQDVSLLTDCSDVIPSPKVIPEAKEEASLPEGKTAEDIERNCPDFIPNLV